MAGFLKLHHYQITFLLDISLFICYSVYLRSPQPGSGLWRFVFWDRADQNSGSIWVQERTSTLGWPLGDPRVTQGSFEITPLFSVRSSKWGVGGSSNGETGSLRK